MKKLFLAILMSAFVLALAGCVPEGMNADFYQKAQQVFNEIDDDTMEMETSDKDDILNFELLQGYAVTEKEEAVITSIAAIVTLQPQMITGDKKVFGEYLKARNKYYSVMEIPKVNQRVFTFTEE